MFFAFTGLIVILLINWFFIKMPTPSPYLFFDLSKHLRPNTTIFSFLYKILYRVCCFFQNFFFDFIPLALVCKFFSLNFLVFFVLIDFLLLFYLFCICNIFSHWWKVFANCWITFFCVIYFVDSFRNICLYVSYLVYWNVCFTCLW